MVSANSAMSVANFVWWCHGALHWKNSAIVPGCLLVIAISLVVSCHMMQASTSNWYEPDPLKTFLCMVLVQMMPLVVLEFKIMSCADPVGLFCKFAVPVTMMHVIFLTIRFSHYESYGNLYLACSAAGAVGAVFTLVKGFHWSPRTLFHYKSVWYLAIMSVLGAAFSHWLEFFLISGDLGAFEWLSKVVVGSSMGAAHGWQGVLDTANSYLEILAFVPAVWMVLRNDKSAGRVQVEERDTKRTSTAFFLFLVGFYLSEDVVNAFEAWEVSSLATVAHIVHFLLLLDFACFILAHIYNPEKLMGDLRKWLPVDLSYDV